MQENTLAAVQISAQVAAEQEGVQMDVDQASSESNSKRKAEEDAPVESFKKAKIGGLCITSPASDTDGTVEAAPSSLKRSVVPRMILARSDWSLSNSDRENCTVFVANLPPSTAEDDLRALFKDVRNGLFRPRSNAEQHLVWSNT